MLSSVVMVKTNAAIMETQKALQMVFHNLDLLEHHLRQIIIMTKEPLAETVLLPQPIYQRRKTKIRFGLWRQNATARSWNM
jgi:uncharacterized protein (DUF2384 family)